MSDNHKDQTNSVNKDTIDVEYKELDQLNMIDKFVTIVKEYCDSPETFVRAGAYNLIASIQGRFTRVVGMPFGSKPNPWFIVSSIPGRMRRSATLSYIEYVYKGVLMKYYDPRIKLSKERIKELKKEEKTDEEIEWERKKELREYVNSTIIEEGSKEGLMDHLEKGYNNGVTEFAIMSPEFGAIISSIMHKQYQFGVSSLLSKLKYAESGTVYLSARGKKSGTRYVPPGLFVTMYATMQEPDQYLTEAQSRQGLLRRLMIDYVKHTDLSMDNWKAPLRSDRYKVWLLLDLYVNELYEKMLITEDTCWYTEKGGDIPAIPIFIETVMKEINEVAREIDEELIQDDSDYLIYKQGTWEQLTELSAVHCIARFERLGESSDLIFMVTQEDLDAAKAFHNALSRHAEEVLDDISKPSSRATSQEKNIERIYRYIYRAGAEGIGQTELGNLAKLLKDPFHKILFTLTGFERIKRKEIRTKGRVKNIYIATAFLEDKQ